MAVQNLISMKAVLGKVPYSKTHIYRLIKSNEFPKAVKVGKARIAFLEDEIVQWQKTRIAAR